MVQRFNRRHQCLRFAFGDSQAGEHADKTSAWSTRRYRCVEADARFAGHRYRGVSANNCQASGCGAGV
jgi:hypothetical protein